MNNVKDDCQLIPEFVREARKSSKLYFDETHSYRSYSKSLFFELSKIRKEACHPVNDALETAGVL